MVVAMGGISWEMRNNAKTLYSALKSSALPRNRITPGGFFSARTILRIEYTAIAKGEMNTTREELSKMELPPGD